MTHSHRELTALLDQHGLHPSRALGQNFVADANTVRRIARLADVGPGDRVLEIGAGLGSLTLALADTGASVTAVEVDRHLVPVLRSVVGDRAAVVEGDATRLDWDTVLGGDAGWVLVANLPYNVATPLVADLLDFVPGVARMLVMVQKEVGERLAAGPGDAAYGAVSVKVSYWATARVAGLVPPTVFVPRPNVDSALVAITRRPAPAVDPALVGPEELFALVRAGFAQRRKMLRRALAGVASPAAFEAAGIAPTARAEELSVEAWGALAAAIAAGRAGAGREAEAGSRGEGGEAGGRGEGGHGEGGRGEAGETSVRPPASAGPAGRR
ncbi:16S rRNA (adenine(1518)-N(6)/adenine(1519)-N(6))-dimethyltransferase RsmA [Acidiferrimicrobium sp. IK]|uniref:16S rRNA (adenine(1518)-N(6)/adenine(1519)-N(6))- dimethyltransferase RsmA n=1 Tax=Acidiferrimicrobium sp. IK TaxID=2871700 RepID=UPI0021CB619D|nr:16S rRNA (adenine(1518)-N(6)/adenine(1519)-N(6))-dimethyltransferase RsmA [Acidiferrimicrobium sp. IK]MCU4185443.1 16S rRNA (adenine(1518)-N(6)/adenine(1519)-N(6))-dimethyltransferase RsmA [Acidiferrimicrobium sp. IK]